LPPQTNPVVFDFDPRWLQANPSPQLALLALLLFVLFTLLALLLLRRLSGARTLVRVLAAMLAALVVAIEVEMALMVCVALAPRWSRSALAPGLLWRLQAGTTSQIDPQGASLENRLPRLAPNLHERPASFAQGVTVVTSNSSGLREREIPRRKAPDEFRIACIGDSWTFGLGVRAHETWVRRMETMLQKSHPEKRIVTINAGMPGASYLQGYLMLTTVVLDYQPDLVLLCGFGAREPLPEVDDLDPQSLGLADLLRRSEVYSILRYNLAGAGGRSPDPVMAIDYARRIADVLDRRGLPSVFLAFNQRPEGRFSGRFPEIDRPDYPLDKLLPTSRRKVISIHPRLYQESPDKFLLSYDKTHPNARGHGEMARLVFTFLEQWGALGGPER